MGRNPLIEIALECERIALEDEYFVTRRLYPNVDFYTGLDLSIHGLPHDDVSGSVCYSAHFRLDRAVGGNVARSRAENRAPAANLSWLGRARLRAR